MKTTVALLCLCLASCASYSEVRHAADSTTLNAAPSRTIKYGDLNLATHDGSVALYRRINDAAFSVCSRMIAASNGPGLMARSNCMRTLIDAAVQDVNRPLLTAVHEGRTSKRTALR